MAGLRCPMQPPTGLVLMQVYVRNLLVTHLCGSLVEPLMAVGCSFFFFFYYLSTNVCLICLKG